MGHVVVGVDGSDESIAALQFAAAEARLRGAPLRVVHAFLVPSSATYTAGALLDPKPFEQAAERLVDSAITAIERELEGVEVETVIECGGGVPVLLDHLASDDLAVVGSRGRGGFKGLLLGSVSQQIVAHAPCPVVVVRSPAPA